MPGCLRQPGPGRAYERRIALLRLVADFLHQVASSPRLALLAPPPGAAHGAYRDGLLRRTRSPPSSFGFSTGSLGSPPGPFCTGTEASPSRVGTPSTTRPKAV